MDLFQRMYPRISQVESAFCPYRVCPLGAHVDHQHGLVTGFALDKGVNIAYTPTENGVIEISSTAFPGKVQFYLNAVPKRRGDWADHLRGAAKALSLRYKLDYGVYALVDGELPIGGLSSSAAVIIAFMSALCRANGVVMSESEIIDAALWAENEYVGVNVGRLDQSCEILCKKSQMLFLDTSDNSYELIPESPGAPPYEIAVFFSGVQRTLVGSAFNMRVDELKAAAYAMMGFSGMEYGKFADAYLRDVPYEVFLEYEGRLPENWSRRARHYYTECDRVRKGVEAWRAGDIARLGQLSFESGNSSIVNYQTGSDELKALYDIMRTTDGIYGGRFSGAGFKGCCMAIIDPSFRDTITRQVTERYVRQFPGLKDDFSVHFCETADGCSFH